MCVTGSREATGTAPSLGRPIWGPHLCQQLQQRPVRTAATEFTQASEEGSGLGGSWVEKNSVGLEAEAQPPAHTPLICPAPQWGSQPSHSPPGALESKRKTLGQPRRAPQPLNSQTNFCGCLSCPLGATKATRTQPRGALWATSCFRNPVSSSRKS